MFRVTGDYAATQTGFCSLCSFRSDTYGSLLASFCLSKRPIYANMQLASEWLPNYFTVN